VHDFVRE
jgi:tRNA pseudouridine13 synthase